MYFLPASSSSFTLLFRRHTDRDALQRIAGRTKKSVLRQACLLLISVSESKTRRGGHSTFTVSSKQPTNSSLVHESLRDPSEIQPFTIYELKSVTFVETLFLFKNDKLPTFQVELQPRQDLILHTYSLSDMTREGDSRLDFLIVVRTIKSFFKEEAAARQKCHPLLKKLEHRPPPPPTLASILFVSYTIVYYEPQKETVHHSLTHSRTDRQTDRQAGRQAGR